MRAEGNQKVKDLPRFSGFRSEVNSAVNSWRENSGRGAGLLGKK